MMHFSRLELYLNVWSAPLTTLAKRFSISNYELEKLCKENNIPLPKAGHWMKVKFGKKVVQVPLPAFFTLQGSSSKIIQPTKFSSSGSAHLKNKHTEQTLRMYS